MQKSKTAMRFLCRRNAKSANRSLWMRTTTCLSRRTQECPCSVALPTGSSRRPGSRHLNAPRLRLTRSEIWSAASSVTTKQTRPLPKRRRRRSASARSTTTRRTTALLCTRMARPGRRCARVSRWRSRSVVMRRLTFSATIVRSTSCSLSPVARTTTMVLKWERRRKRRRERTRRRRRRTTSLCTRMARRHRGARSKPVARDRSWDRSRRRAGCSSCTTRRLCVRT
mmetsp:Transcript_53857/g.123933  ORF Transcript_53857/g.123933 Transcript_53857/m.123933 type:complete len:226 (+) Transcript_53857:561-1238(+)